MSANPDDDKFRKEFQKFVDKPRVGWLLTPVHVKQAIPLSASKLGGVPYQGNLKEWPTCSFCDVSLNFILQLNRHRFPQMWFPRGKNLFQIFRCSNDDYCDRPIDEVSDRFMLGVFAKTLPGRRTPLEYPEDDLENSAEYISEHKLLSKKIKDYPSFYEGREAWWGKSWVRFQDKYTTSDPDADSWFYKGKFWNQIQNQDGLKIAGLPSWLQSGYPPQCECGRTKEFIFQLPSLNEPKAEMSIGGSGNIYYFVCRRCGEKSLETLWDCG